MTSLPKWVWDLIADLEDEEDVHPKLYVDTVNGYVRYDWCPAKPLERVPDDVRSHAQVIAAYRHGQGSDQPATAASPAAEAGGAA